MKRLFCLLLMIVCAMTLWACTTSTCTTHIDNDGNLQCDICGTMVECTQHKDTNEDLKCDKCNADVTCNHRDDDYDGACDIAACPYVFCEHEYEEEYSYNRTHHYFEPICDCEIEPKDKEEHVDANNDGVCDVCAWDYNHKHTYATEWSHDATNHWYAVTCDHDVTAKDLAAHVDEDNNGICDGCYWNYDHEHTYATEWSCDSENHWYAPACTHDIEDKNVGAHVDANNDGACDVCAWNDGHEHVYNEEVWSIDDTNHWHAPTCGHNVAGKDLAAHADENDDGLCDTCEYIVCDEHEMDMSKWEWDATTHWHPAKCGHESAAMEAAGHSFDAEGKLCTICGYDTKHVHEFSEDWTSDLTSHWHVSTCHSFITTEPEAHVDENNDGVCDVCEKQFCEHTYATDWSRDTEYHWHATTCGHTGAAPADKAAHADENNDGICDGCAWNYDHEHTYATTWSRDTEYHWHAVACTHTIEVADKAAHADENNDGICDGCDWNYDHEHTYATTWSYDLQNHYYAVTCGHNVPAKDITPHTDVANNGYCSGCQTQYCAHEFSTKWSYDETHHWFATVCTHSGATKDVAEHYDVNNDGICDGCAWDYDHEHTYATTWSRDTEYHWHAVTCTHSVEVADKAAHADANNDGICDGCAWNYDHEHTYATDWSRDKTFHWHAVSCTHDVEVADKAAHVDENNDGICDGCDWNYDHEHTYATEYSYDGNNHWFAVTCGHNVAVKDVTAHTDENADGICEVCNKQFCEHYYAETWIYDGKYHWHESGCGHYLAPEKQLHVDTNADEICDACGRSMICEHTYDESKWVTDGTHHWHAPTCGHDETDTADTRVPHTDNDNNLHCDVCEKAYDSESGDGDINEGDAVVTPDHVITP